MTLAKATRLILLLSLLGLGVGLILSASSAAVYSSSDNNTMTQEEQNQILCNELAILNSLVQDTETLPSTAAGNSTSERECGFKPNINEGNQSNDE